MSYIDFSDKIGTLDDAVSKIKSGDVIWLGSTLSVPGGFLDKLAEKADRLRNVTLIGNMFVRKHEIFTNTKYQDSFMIISINNRPIMPAAMANVHFVYPSGGSVEENICIKFGVNVLAVEVCSPDNDGRCGFGAFGTRITPQVNAYEGIKKRIVIINDSQPEGGKDARDFIDLATCDCIVINHHSLFSNTEGNG